MLRRGGPPHQSHIKDDTCLPTPQTGWPEPKPLFPHPTLSRTTPYTYLRQGRCRTSGRAEPAGQPASPHLSCRWEERREYTYPLYTTPKTQRNSTANRRRGATRGFKHRKNTAPPPPVLRNKHKTEFSRTPFFSKKPLRSLSFAAFYCLHCSCRTSRGPRQAGKTNKQPRHTAAV